MSKQDLDSNNKPLPGQLTFSFYGPPAPNVPKGWAPGTYRRGHIKGSLCTSISGGPPYFVVESVYGDLAMVRCRCHRRRWAFKLAWASFGPMEFGDAK